MAIIKREALAIIQARHNFARFPVKVVKKINNKSVLEILIRRLLKSEYFSKIIVACTKIRNFKTFISQEFLKKNFLASNYIYLCTEHNSKTVNQYFEILDDIFYKIKKIKNSNEDFKLQLDCPCCIRSLRDKIYD
jgi:CMP-2-keto-3-deoxyoctulosonic acid synthetase